MQNRETRILQRVCENADEHGEREREKEEAREREKENNVLKVGFAS